MKKSFSERVKVRLGLYERRFLHDPLATVPEFKHRMSREAQNRDGNRTLSYQAIAENLLFAVQYVAEGGVPGEIAEFGCMTGRTANVISAAMASFRIGGKLHLFDSFEGLPKTTNAVDATSDHVKDGTWGPGTCKGITPEALRKKCLNYLKDDQIRIYEGWFSQNMTRIPAGTKFAMLHVDCDLYESTMDCLDFLFKNKMVSEGAIILFDDWYCNHSSNNHGERKAWKELVEKYQIHAEDHGGYAWGGFKLIVHDYAQK
jgi:O-methyltransferase